MMGALSMIRFRVSLREPKDLIFIFASLSIGVATGVHSYSLAVAGTLGFSAIAYVLFRAPFASDMIFDGLLRFNVEHSHEMQSQVDKILKDFCATFALVTLRESGQGSRLDYAYQIKLERGKSFASLVQALKEIPQSRSVQVLLQESTIEV